MEMKDTQFVFTDDQGNETLCEILFTFNSEEFNKNYVLFYPVGSEHEDGSVDVMAASYIENEDGIITIYAPNTEYAKVRDALQEAMPDLDLTVDTIAWMPKTYTKLESDKEKEQFNRMLEMLEDDDDVQEVYHNVEGLND